MSDLTLEKAWKDRSDFYFRGSKLIEDGNAAWKEIVSLPGSTRVGVWLGISEASAEAAGKVLSGYELRLAGDKIWHDAVVKTKGDKARLTWEYENEKKGYRCIISSGETFEP